MMVQVVSLLCEKHNYTCMMVYTYIKYYAYNNMYTTHNQAYVCVHVRNAIMIYIHIHVL